MSIVGFDDHKTRHLSTLLGRPVEAGSAEAVPDSLAVNLLYNKQGWGNVLQTAAFDYCPYPGLANWSPELGKELLLEGDSFKAMASTFSLTCSLIAAGNGVDVTSAHTANGLFATDTRTGKPHIARGFQPYADFLGSWIDRLQQLPHVAAPNPDQTAAWLNQEVYDAMLPFMYQELGDLVTIWSGTGQDQGDSIYNILDVGYDFKALTDAAKAEGLRVAVQIQKANFVDALQLDPEVERPLSYLPTRLDSADEPDAPWPYNESERNQELLLTTITYLELMALLLSRKDLQRRELATGIVDTNLNPSAMPLRMRLYHNLFSPFPTGLDLEAYYCQPNLYLFARRFGWPAGFSNQGLKPIE